MSYLPDMDDIDMTCSDFVIPLEMLTCSEKHPVLELTMAILNKVVTDRWPSIRDFISSIISCKF